MKCILLLFLIALFLFSCGKKQEQPTPEDIKRQELELKQKQLDSIENEMKKDSIKRSNYNNKIMSESFSFMNKDMVFGSSYEDFLKTFTEFKENNELKSGNEKVASYTSRPKGCEINYNVYFGNSGLNKFEMKSNCSSGQDEKIIKIITSQFKLIPSKDFDEEEMGDVVQTYKKGKLIATEFIGGFYQLTIEYKK
jgi:hypothetical protein